MIKKRIKEGKSKCIKEGSIKKQREIAKNLLISGVSIDIIKKSTGLSKEEILNLIDKK